MRSISPLRDRRGWIVSETSKTGVAIFIYTRYRAGEANVPHHGSEIWILPCEFVYLQAFDTVGADIIRPLFYCHPSQIRLVQCDPSLKWVPVWCVHLLRMNSNIQPRRAVRTVKPQNSGVGIFFTWWIGKGTAMIRSPDFWEWTRQKLCWRTVCFGLFADFT